MTTGRRLLVQSAIVTALAAMSLAMPKPAQAAGCYVCANGCMDGFTACDIVGCTYPQALCSERDCEGMDGSHWQKIIQCDWET